jgi:hypothetical protein
MNVIGHYAPGVQAITNIIEMNQGIDDDLRGAAIAQHAFSEVLIEKPFTSVGERSVE